MNTRVLGQTGRVVSAVGCGGIPLTRLTMNQAVDLIRGCFRLGVTFFDTAHSYRDSEVKLGAALSDMRKQVFLATKTKERHAEGAYRDLEESLRNFRTDYIDLYQFHNVSTPADLEKILGPGGAYEAVVKAKTEGRVAHIGFSSHHKGVAIAACQTGKFETVQFAFNFVESDAQIDLFPLARKLGLGIIAMKPFAGGVLEATDFCVKFFLDHPAILPIPGFERLSEAEQFVKIYRHGRVPTADERRHMDRIRSTLVNKFCHRCGYCLPCPQGVQIPLILKLPSLLKRMPLNHALFKAQEPIKSGAFCIECGECQEKCPYGLDIPPLIQENIDLYHRTLAGIEKQQER